MSDSNEKKSNNLIVFFKLFMAAISTLTPVLALIWGGQNKEVVIVQHQNLKDAEGDNSVTYDLSEKKTVQTDNDGVISEDQHKMAKESKEKAVSQNQVEKKKKLKDLDKSYSPTLEHSVEKESYPIKSVVNKDGDVVTTKCNSIRTSAGYLCQCYDYGEPTCKSKTKKMPEDYDNLFWYWDDRFEDVPASYCYIKLDDGLQAEEEHDDKNTNWLMLDDYYLINQNKAYQISSDNRIWNYVNTQDEYHPINIPLGNNYVMGVCDDVSETR